jgi:hypothetical protein
MLLCNWLLLLLFIKFICLLSHQESIGRYPHAIIVDEFKEGEDTAIVSFNLSSHGVASLV